MEQTVLFRDFEERDIDFIYECKNDEKLNSMIVGDYHQFTYKEAADWVHGCMGEHETYKFWAICTNDAEKRIVGWVSLSQIDTRNRSACHHGIVIGDNAYRDGYAMFEAMFFSIRYAFEILQLHRLYGSCLSRHPVSPSMCQALGFRIEGIQREAVFRDNKYHDILNLSLLDAEYNQMQENGQYEINALIQRFVEYARKKS